MYWVLALLGVVVICLWFVSGMTSSRMNERDKADEEYQAALKKNREADDLLSDYERVKRVQDHFNK
jgi:F0F1-type ATP synthase membrane subunit b/b'